MRLPVNFVSQCPSKSRAGRTLRHTGCQKGGLLYAMCRGRMPSVLIRSHPVQFTPKPTETKILKHTTRLGSSKSQCMSTSRKRVRVVSQQHEPLHCTGMGNEEIEGRMEFAFGLLVFWNMEETICKSQIVQARGICWVTSLLPRLCFKLDSLYTQGRISLLSVVPCHIFGL